MFDNTGTEVVRYVYVSWGKVLSMTGSLASTLGTIQPFCYRGYVYDVETGLYYLRSRYYNPEIERFLNADKLIEINNQYNSNLFSYCANAPIGYYDDSGSSFWDALKRVGEAALAIAAVAIVVAVVIGTGGSAGFVLTSGGVISAAAVADTVATSAIAIGAAGDTVLLASKIHDFSEFKQKKGTPHNNRSQNAQFDEAVRQLQKNHNINMTKDRIRRLHDAIKKCGYDLQEMIDVGIELFGGSK